MLKRKVPWDGAIDTSTVPKPAEVMLQASISPNYESIISIPAYTSLECRKVANANAEYVEKTHKNKQEIANRRVFMGPLFKNVHNSIKTCNGLC